ncbi:MAG: hypothetical protein IJM23_02570 [Lachnospiraceae bacterium]|nr:hypothetical protein [Lachnospiraceae bacterium]
MNRKTFNITTIIFAIVYVAVLIFGNVKYASVPVAVEPGSYADQFAADKHLKKIDIADSEKGYFDWRYEQFEYNTIDNNDISIERYTGISKDLVIPSEIEGHKVTGIGKDFFNGLGLSSVYLPVTVAAIDAEPVKGIKIYCDKDSAFYKENEESDWDIELLYDSATVNYSLGDIPYGYSETSDGVELTRYYGHDDIIVIPSYVNGKPVTKVSFDMLGNFRMVVFPKTVTEITGQFGKLLYSAVFFIELIFSIIAFIVVIIAVNIILPRYRNDVSEYMLSGSQMLITFLYLTVQLCFSIYSIYFSDIGAVVAFVISFLLLIGYVAFVFLLQGGREHAKMVDEKIEAQTSVMRDLKSSVVGLSDGITDKEILKPVERVMEEIKYSALRTKNPEVEDQLIQEIDELKDLIRESRKDEIISKCSEIMTLIKRR